MEKNTEKHADVDRAQEILGREFRDQNYLIEALQAAGSGLPKVGTRSIPDGNKNLAQLGELVMKVVLQEQCYRNGQDRETSTNLLNRVVEKGNLKDLAKTSNLELCIAPNPSQANQPAAPTLLVATTTAVIGAVFLDSEKDFNAARNAMVNIGVTDLKVVG